MTRDQICKLSFPQVKQLLANADAAIKAGKRVEEFKRIRADIASIVSDRHVDRNFWDASRGRY